MKQFATTQTLTQEVTNVKGNPTTAGDTLEKLENRAALIEAILDSDDPALDTLQEAITQIKANLGLFASYYKAVTVATYANAISAATGAQKKIITVTTDETDENNKNKYFYEGVEGQLDLIF